MKWELLQNYNDVQRSPSMRREWIEIILTKIMNPESGVSLHAEGVD